MDDDVRIVRAGAERLAEVEPLWKAMQAHHAEVGLSPAAVRPFRSPDEAWRRRRVRYEKWLSGPDAFLLLAEREGGDAVGYAVIVVGGGEASIETGERVAELASLSVLPEARGRGVGRRLVDRMHEELRSLDVRELTLSVMDGNERATRFYERLGMRPYLATLVGLVPEGGEPA